MGSEKLEKVENFMDKNFLCNIIILDLYNF